MNSIIVKDGHLPVELPKDKTDNLIKLADYLSSNNLRAKFDMKRFADAINWQVTNGSKLATECGAVGCGIGHGPYAGIPKKQDEIWPQYAERVFINSCEDMVYKFCFDDSWSKYDNTPSGCAKRIRYMLKNGIPSGIDQEFPNYEKLIRLYSGS